MFYFIWILKNTTWFFSGWSFYKSVCKHTQISPHIKTPVRRDTVSYQTHQTYIDLTQENPQRFAKNIFRLTANNLEARSVWSLVEETNLTWPRWFIGSQKDCETLTRNAGLLQQQGKSWGSQGKDKRGQPKTEYKGIKDMAGRDKEQL